MSILLKYFYIMFASLSSCFVCNCGAVNIPPMCVHSMCITFYYRYCVTRNKSSYYYTCKSWFAMFVFVVKLCWRTGILHFCRSIAPTGNTQICVYIEYLLYIYVNVRFVFNRCIGGGGGDGGWLAGTFWVQFCCRVLSVFVLRTMRFGNEWSCCQCWDWCCCIAMAVDDVFVNLMISFDRFLLLPLLTAYQLVHSLCRPFNRPLRKMCI